MTTQTSAVARWVYGNVRQYPWAQCRFCGRAQSHDCAAVACLLCGTVQCFGNGSGNGTCSVCYVGYIPGWSRQHFPTDMYVCGRKGCSEPAVCKAPRVARVCKAHAEVTKTRDGGQWRTLAEYAADHVRHRDSGQGWQRWTLVA